MKCTAKLKIKSVDRAGAAFSGGLRKGDAVLSVNGFEVTDELDFAYLTAEPQMTIEIERHGQPKSLTFLRDEGMPIGVQLYDLPINRCTNRCIFCFIDQMPPGLRSGLYIKDEDFTHSFLNGNYVTLTGASKDDLEKIAAIGLSPLYISVHATDPAVRMAMLRNRKAPPILEQLTFLVKSGISFHTQIVVCPGYNDGAVLEKSIRDLDKFRDHLLSIAVVPVGLTRFRTMELKGVDSATARAICEKVGSISDGMKARDGVRKLFLADEFFIKAAMTIPGRDYYEDYPQIENGVGLIRQLLNDWERSRRSLNARKLRNKFSKFLIVSSQSAQPFLERIAGQIMKKVNGIGLTVEAAENDYFGNTVTVAGLLTARDLLKTARKAIRCGSFDAMIVPSVMFNYLGHTLDGYSLKRLEHEAGIPTFAADTISELLDHIFNGRTDAKPERRS